MQDIAVNCPPTKFEGGLQAVHFADDTGSAHSAYDDDDDDDDFFLIFHIQQSTQHRPAVVLSHCGGCKRNLVDAASSRRKDKFRRTAQSVTFKCYFQSQFGVRRIVHADLHHDALLATNRTRHSSHSLHSRKESHVLERFQIGVVSR